jgi:hypothetical protein
MPSLAHYLPWRAHHEVLALRGRAHPASRGPGPAQHPPFPHEPRPAHRGSQARPGARPTLLPRPRSAHPTRRRPARPAVLSSPPRAAAALLRPQPAQRLTQLTHAARTPRRHARPCTARPPRGSRRGPPRSPNPARDPPFSPPSGPLRPSQAYPRCVSRVLELLTRQRFRGALQRRWRQPVQRSDACSRSAITGVAS